jgi:signal transduction histidine kinase/ActR/RegA family two-component response regulator
MGTTIAIVLGGIAMMVVAVNIQYMTNIYPDSGGAFSYTKRTLGYDHAFLCSWSLVLAFTAVMWANATSIVLMSRFLLGSVFQVGFHYTVAGYDVYLGEVVITLVTLGLFGLLSLGRKHLVTAVNTGFALTLFFGVLLCLFFVLTNNGGARVSLDPPFQPTGVPFLQVMSIVSLAPWAYVGFESVTHSASEFGFSPKRLLPLLVLALVCGAMVYVSTTIISIAGTPSYYPNWVAYIAELGNISGLTGLPVFHAIQRAAGQPGLTLLAFVIISALSTSLLGLYRATSRLILVVAEDEVIPSWFAKTNDEGVPTNAIKFIMAISVAVPFVGRAAIGWIVDVTSICASIAYCYISVAAFVVAKKHGDRRIMTCGMVGIAVSVVFFVLPLIPNLWSVTTLSTESYLIFAAWSILGLIFFRYIFQRDRQNRFGKSTIVWIAMLFIIFYTSTMWVRQAAHETTTKVMENISENYLEEYAMHRVHISDSTREDQLEFLEDESSRVQSSLLNTSLIQMLLVILSLGIMFSIYALMRKREREHDLSRLEAERTSAAKTEFLSNMSHDIRTPMNAIIGYTSIAQREGTTLEETRNYLKKIDASSQHLLALINDVLEMSRIESGKMDLEVGPCDLRETMDEVHDMFATQMAVKRIAFSVDASDVRDRYVLCDKNRLNRVLLNLLSNAYKFTPEDGAVSVRLLQVDPMALEQGSEDVAVAGQPMGHYQLRVKDSGIGMTPEFAKHVFEAFEREHNSTVSGIQGTGLGMAITKSIVDLMGGTIGIVTAPNQGTEFIVDVSFELLAEDEIAGLLSEHEVVDSQDVDFTNRHVLLVEDNDINREIAEFLLEDLGFEVTSAVDGQDALDTYLGAAVGTFDIVLTDIQMPVMDGYELAHKIRELADPARASVPIVACSANAFEEDIQASLAAGMNAHLSKPLDMAIVTQVLASVLQ